ncbi:MAG: GNAT family N-acetyltransferase [Rhodobacteraceae bacterium]|nr:MAG: GNAT family N-acetyltransferase [Paracoccaceae bacterium]
MHEMAITFRLVQDEGDLARLDRALRRLSADIAEDYATHTPTLTRALLGAQPAALGLLALRGDNTLGAALFSPNFSTVRGAAGIYVSDLWVSADARGRGLGARLLAQIARDGAARWGANWLRLAAYHHSHDALRFYARLGFAPANEQQELRLGAEGFAKLTEGAA